MTGSVALYSDALETIINVAAADTAPVALRISARPANAGHPYASCTRLAWIPQA